MAKKVKVEKDVYEIGKTTFYEKEVRHGDYKDADYAYRRTSATYEKGKEDSVIQDDYVDGVHQYKTVQSHYDKDGKLDHWTVDKHKEEMAADDGMYSYDIEPTKTYKRDDIKAVLSGDVAGTSYLEANKPEYFDKNGRTVWNKEEKKKSRQRT